MTRRFILSLILASLALPVAGADLVREFSGDGAATTAEFEVEAPWILDWRVNSEFQRAMAIEIHLVDSLTGLHRGLILQTKYPGNGVKLFNQSGRYKFRISSTLARWNLRIEELTPAEAELYTPRKPR
jgi:hypothetical protein